LTMSRSVKTFFNPGDVLGKWTVLESAQGSRARVKCKCSCGTVKDVLAYNLRGRKNSGCRKCKSTRKPVYSGLQTHPEYLRILRKISDIFRRCYNPKCDHFYHYGSRGIGVYLPWHTDRKAMMRYLTSLHGWDDPLLQIDRIDNDGDYCPGNLRFVTRSVNILNRKKLVDGKRTKGYCEKCDDLFIRKKTHQRFCCITCRNKAIADARRTQHAASSN